MSNGFGYKKKGAFGNVLYVPHDDSYVETNGVTVRPSSGMETISFDENVAEPPNAKISLLRQSSNIRPTGCLAADQSRFSRINRNGARRESEIG